MHYVITRGRNIREQMSAITGFRVEILCQSYINPLLAGLWGARADDAVGKQRSSGQELFTGQSEVTYCLNWEYGYMSFTCYMSFLVTALKYHYEVECHWPFEYFPFVSNIFIFFALFLFFFLIDFLCIDCHICWKCFPSLLCNFQLN